MPESETKPFADLDTYQAAAFSSAIYPGKGENQVLYPILGLCGEAGELADKLARRLWYKVASPDGIDRKHELGLRSLALLARSGRLAELVKKAYRNDPPGVMTDARRVELQQIAGEIEHRADTVNSYARLASAGEPVVLPPLEIDGVELDLLRAELGDVLWYVAGLATELGLSLSDVAAANLSKLARRKEEGTLAGDNRGDDLPANEA